MILWIFFPFNILLIKTYTFKIRIKFLVIIKANIIGNSILKNIIKIFNILSNLWELENAMGKGQKGKGKPAQKPNNKFKKRSPENLK